MLLKPEEITSLNDVRKPPSKHGKHGYANNQHGEEVPIIDPSHAKAAGAPIAVVVKCVSALHSYSEKVHYNPRSPRRTQVYHCP
jgi:hypothetical protein